jgi:ribulose-bisphosphate carboxylase large chain
LPNVTAPPLVMLERARLACDAGAGGLLVAPGLVGLEAMRCVADADGVGLPIMSHPALLGSHTMSPAEGLSHGVLYGQINRLAGADATIFPNYGGRFSFTAEQCRQIIAGCAVEMGAIRSIFPVPAGGMTMQRVPELCEFYGQDVILLIGGDLHRHGPDLAENCRRFARLVEGA